MNNKIDLSKVSAEYLTVYDVTNDEIICTRDGDVECYPASITKILNAVVALKYCKLNDKFVVGDELIEMRRSPDPSVAGIKEGEVFTLEQLLYASLLPSGNDAAYTIGYNVVNSMEEYKTLSVKEKVAKYAQLMNEYAKSLGCKSTSFVTLDGNDHVDKKVVRHLTCTNDLAIIMKDVLKNDDLVKVISTPSKTINVGDHIYSWNNTNRLIHKDSDFYCPYAIGGKTGTTNLAGYCLLVAGKNDERTIIVALTYAGSGQKRFTDAKYIFECLLDK